MKPSYEELKALLAAKETEMAELREAAKSAKASLPVSFTVTDAGKISARNIGQRFPVTLGVGQWEMIYAAHEAFLKFVAENQGKLSVRLGDGTYGIPKAVAPATA